MDKLDRVLASDNLVSVLGREIRVRVLEISGSGCLFESTSRLPPGATGSLAATIDGCDIRTTFGLFVARSWRVRALYFDSALSTSGRPGRQNSRCVGL